MNPGNESPAPVGEKNIRYIGATTAIISTLVVMMLANPDGWQNLLRYFGVAMLITLVLGVLMLRIRHSTLSRRVWDTAIRSSGISIVVYLVAGLAITNAQEHPGVSTPGLFILLILAVPAIFLGSFVVALVLLMLFSRGQAQRQ